MNKNEVYTIAQDKLLQITKLCLLINANTELGATCTIAGHVESLDVRVVKTKENYENKLYNSGLIFYGGSYRDTIGELDKVILKLVEYLNSGNSMADPELVE